MIDSALPGALGAGTPAMGMAEAKFSGVIGLSEVTTSKWFAVPHMSCAPGAVKVNVPFDTEAFMGLPGGVAMRA